MSLRTKYLTWIFAVHMLLAISCYFAINVVELPLLILGLELIVAVSLFLSFWFYNRFQLPLKFIKFNKQALLEQDFNLKYLETDHLELNKLYEIFNLMLDRIMHERRYSEEQHHFLKEVINASPAGIILLDYDDKIELVNPMAKKLIKFDEQDVGKTLNASKSFIQNIDLSTKEAKTVKVGSQSIKCTVNRRRISK